MKMIMWSRHSRRTVPTRRISLRCVDGCQKRLDAELGGTWDECAAVAAVTVADQIAGLLRPRRGRDELAPDPLAGRMGGDVEMDEPTPVMGDEEENVERLQADSRDGEEVGRPDVRGVVPQEGAPGLRWWPLAGLSPVAADRLSANVEAQLAQFAADADASPARVLPGEALDESTQLRCESGATWAAVATLPTPVTSPGGAVPADDGIGLDDGYC